MTKLRLEGKIAKEKNKLKYLQSYTSTMSHEFRTPLTVMLGMSEQLVKDETDDPKRNKLSLIKRTT